jgi:hypothetical protein
MQVKLRYEEANCTAVLGRNYVRAGTRSAASRSAGLRAGVNRSRTRGSEADRGPAVSLAMELQNVIRPWQPSRDLQELTDSSRANGSEAETFDWIS